jgi:aspartyl-tRNA(Asn)/glutamyl-tRNA(Gln) amidotransferase subunit C
MWIDVVHIAKLARLELSEDEQSLYAAQLGKVLEHIEQLNTLDTANISPTSHVLEISNVFRSDMSRPSQSHDDALGNAPDRYDNFYRVPRIIE